MRIVVKWSATIEYNTDFFIDISTNRYQTTKLSGMGQNKTSPPSPLWALERARVGITERLLCPIVPDAEKIDRQTDDTVRLSHRENARPQEPETSERRETAIHHENTVCSANLSARKYSVHATLVVVATCAPRKLCSWLIYMCSNA
ncbi:hypothetical protein J6590_052843 [Homalodisca vitripennis]|nr:hypothetical protein J6590_052843 [Homalodisca vitripennis]